MMAKRWYLWLPGLVFLLEHLLETPRPFLTYHFFLAFEQQTLLTLSNLGLSLSRILAAYYLPALIIEALFRCAARKPWWPALCWLGVYGLIASMTFQQYPAVRHLLPVGFLKPLAFFCAGTFLWQWRARSLSALPRAKFVWGSMALVAFLFLSRPQPWEGTLKSLSKTKQPNFLLLSFDSISADLWEDEKIAPLWQKVKSGTYYSKAYAPSNSTFTTWFSILSGKLPIESGVELMHPKNRFGKVSSRDLLPWRLKPLGYQTVYMTDCASTFLVPKKYGFDQTYQVDRGTLGCGGSYLASLHLMTNAMPWLFPEHGSFCSASFRAQGFLAQVLAKQKELDQLGSPYLLAVHSCLGHQDMHKHGAGRKAHSVTAQDTSQSLFLKSGLGRVDEALHRLVQQTKNSERLYRVFFSDHGTRIDTKDGRWHNFTHALGYPINRYQYRVPLHVWKPEKTPRKESPKLTVLTDLFPWILNQATGNESLLPSRKRLQLTSALPVSIDHVDEKLTPIFLRNGMNDEGLLFFQPDDAKGMLQNRPVAHLEWPLRTLRFVDGSEKKYCENLDPENRNPVSEKEDCLEKRKGRPLGPPSRTS